MGLSLNKCAYRIKCPCNNCQKANKCQLPLTLCDADVISSAFLDEENTGDANDFLGLNRRKLRIAFTNEIAGETLRALIAETKNEELLKDTLIDLAKQLNGFKFLEPVYHDSEFMDILQRLFQSKELRCGDTDRLHIATAIYCKMKFFTFDEKIKEDKDTINRIFSKEGYQLKPYLL